MVFESVSARVWVDRLDLTVPNMRECHEVRLVLCHAHTPAHVDRKKFVEGFGGAWGHVHGHFGLGFALISLLFNYLPAGDPGF